MKIFLSYNRKNQSFVTHIAEQLESLSVVLGDDVFFDQYKLESGDPWPQKIQDALVHSDACVVFIGEQGIGGWQDKEVLKAIDLLESREARFRIIPVIVPHSNREHVEKSFPWYLADMQWIEFTSPSDADALHKLVVALRENTTVFPVPDNGQPYKGLESFGVDDAAFFFGRTFDVNRVFYYHLRLTDHQFGKQFLAIIGNSGSGKSSFARAGLLASLKAGRFAGSSEWTQVIIKPDAKPLANLAIALEQAGIITDTTDFKTKALQDPEALYDRLGVWSKKLILLIDQFEEVVTHASQQPGQTPADEAAQKQDDHAIRTAFLANLTEAVKSPHLVCIITMRSDFYASFAPYRDFNHLLRHNNYTLAEIDASTSDIDWQRYIRDMIRKPAQLKGVQIDHGLVTRIINDLKAINGVLPVLQLALQQLWAVLEKPGRTGDKSRITTQDYTSLAKDRGIEGIIEEHANTVFDALTSRSTNARLVSLFRAIFIELVETTSGREDVRKTISLTRLRAKLIPRFSEEELTGMLETLPGEKSRLIRINGEKDADKTVDIIHEVLIRKWDKLKGWINERREALAYRQTIENDIIQYEGKTGSLYSGRELTTARNWQKTNPDLTEERIRAFIDKSRQRQQRLNYAVLVSIALVVIIAIIGWLYYPIYQANNSTLARYWKDRNYELNEINNLKISDLNDLKYLLVFDNLDSLEIDANSLNFNQIHLNYLPNRLIFLSIKNARFSENINFNRFMNIKNIELTNIFEFNSLNSIQLAKSLQSLTLSNLDMNTLDGLEQVKEIKSLFLFYLPKLKNLKDLQNADSLQAIKLSYLQGLNDWSGLGYAKSLKSISINGSGAIDMSFIKRLGKIERIVLDEGRIVPGIGRSGFLLTIPLELLYLQNTSIDYLHFSEVKVKPKVFIFNNVFENEKQITEMTNRNPQTVFVNAQVFNNNHIIDSLMNVGL